MPVLLAALVVALVGIVFAAVSVGAVTIPYSTAWGVVVNHIVPGSVPVTWSPGFDTIIWQIRLPRTLLGAIVGAGLALIGAALQAITRNPLADPQLLGISSGAALGAILVLLEFGMFLGLATVPIFAFAGALLATVLVATVAGFTHSTDASRLVLTGVAISFVISALGSLVIFLGDPRATQSVIFWMLGGLGLAQWAQLPYPLVALLGCGAFLLLNAGKLNAMTLGDETATTLGIPAQRFRMLVFVVCALLTGAIVAFSGVISFVGLMVPHFARLIVGGDYRRVLPVSALIGAIFLIGADMLARTLIAPRDMPIGVLTGLIGGVFFVILLRGRRGEAA